MELQKIIQKIIQKIKYTKTIMSYATNSIYINLFDNDNFEIGYFMINPSWRIINNNELLQSSDVYPFHSKYQESELDKENHDFHKWCSLTDSFRQERIEKISIGSNGDIEFKWKSGAILQSYIFDNEDYSYYFYYLTEKMMYEVWYGKCIEEFYERKQRKNKE